MNKIQKEILRVMENTMNQGYPINNPFGSSQRGNLSSMGTPIQYPYNNLIMNSPYGEEIIYITNKIFTKLGNI